MDNILMKLIPLKAGSLVIKKISSGWVHYRFQYWGSKVHHDDVARMTEDGEFVILPSFSHGTSSIRISLKSFIVENNSKNEKAKNYFK